jgi:nucleotide-binding universal stress UspA family protein
MFKSIVVGTDGSPTATEAVRRAAELARLTGANLHLVHGFRPAPAVAPMAMVAATGMALDTGPLTEQLREEAQAILERALSQRDAEGIFVERHARAGGGDEVILGVAREVDADLIVVGNRGMSGAKRFLLGSVPNRVAHHAPCNVMIVATS